MIVIVLPDLSDEDQLLAQAKRGSQEAIMQIYDSYFSPVYNFIRLRVENRELAEDLASDVFVKFVESVRGKNAPRTTLRGWLFRVARNMLADHYGTSRKITHEALEEWIPASSDDEPEMIFIRNMSADRARRALQMLVAEQQEVLLLRFGQSLSLQETADIMGKQVGAVKSIQFRAVNTLRKVLGEMRWGVENV